MQQEWADHCWKMLPVPLRRHRFSEQILQMLASGGGIHFHSWKNSRGSIRAMTGSAKCGTPHGVILLTTMDFQRGTCKACPYHALET